MRAAILSAAVLASCAVAGFAAAQPKPPPLGMAPVPVPPPVAPGPALPIGKPPPLGATAAPPRPNGAAAVPAPPQVAAIPGKPPPAPPGTPGLPGAPGGLRQASSGTGFVVAQARLLTNHHVAQGCTEMRARTSSGTELRATVTATDRERDLALLVVHGEPGPVLRFRPGPEIRRGEGVVTYGFPLAGLLSSGPTLTTGEVSALAGLGDNPRQYQISAPVQPGNSGGPLLDMSGHIVGVVVSKLNAQRVAQRTGDIPQNVNFAVKGAEAIEFLRRNGVQPELAEASAPPLRSAAEVGDVAHPSTVFLRCMR